MNEPRKKYKKGTNDCEVKIVLSEQNDGKKRKESSSTVYLSSVVGVTIAS